MNHEPHAHPIPDPQERTMISALLLAGCLASGQEATLMQEVKAAVDAADLLLAELRRRAKP